MAPSWRRNRARSKWVIMRRCANRCGEPHAPAPTRYRDPAMRSLAATLVAFALMAAVPAVAEQEPPAQVGRVSFIQGTLAFHTEGEAAWSAAAVNFPVATGSAFW